MPFIAKNPLALPEVGAPSSLPAGTRGLFAGKDGFYEIDSDNIVRKLATKEYVVEHVGGLLDNKVDKVSGKDLSEANFTSEEKRKLNDTRIFTDEEKDKLSQTQIFTDELKARLENNTFDGYIETYNEYDDDITEYFDFDNYSADGVYKIYERQRSDDTVTNHYVLCVDTSSLEDVRQTLICLSNGEIKQRFYFGEWKVISVSQADLNKYVSKENGKGLSSNDFTDDLKTRLADSVIVSTLVEHGDSAKEYFNGKTGFGAEFIQWDEDDGVSDAQVLIFTWGERYVQNSTEYYEPGNYQSVIYPDGEIYYRTKLFEEEWTEAFEDPMYIEWEKVSVSQNDLNKYVSKEKGKGLSANDFTDELKNKLEAMSEGGADLTVDSELSKTSENPVQNKVITAELNASIKMSEYVDLYDNIVEYFNGKTGFGAEFVKYDMDGFVTEPQTLIFTWGGFQSGDALLDYQTVIFPEGDIYHRTKSYDEEWLTPEDQTNFWNECGWKKISVSQTDLDDAIGDIETSLENIIKKYGLGGDGV